MTEDTTVVYKDRIMLISRGEITKMFLRDIILLSKYQTRKGRWQKMIEDTAWHVGRRRRLEIR